jgi:hypothetical protein
LSHVEVSVGGNLSEANGPNTAIGPIARFGPFIGGATLNATGAVLFATARLSMKAAKRLDRQPSFPT